MFANEKFLPIDSGIAEIILTNNHRKVFLKQTAHPVQCSRNFSNVTSNATFQTYWLQNRIVRQNLKKYVDHAPSRIIIILI